MPSAGFCLSGHSFEAAFDEKVQKMRCVVAAFTPCTLKSVVCSSDFYIMYSRESKTGRQGISYSCHSEKSFIWWCFPQAFRLCVFRNHNKMERICAPPLRRLSAFSAPTSVNFVSQFFRCWMCQLEEAFSLLGTMSLASQFSPMLQPNRWVSFQ